MQQKEQMFVNDGSIIICPTTYDDQPNNDPILQQKRESIQY